MLKGLRFPDNMISWIMECISTPKFSISINGTPHGYFQGARGLRQGDPLSPYLFVIGMEYLSRKLNTLKGDRLYRFHPKCSRLKITHLAFADDLLLFGRADMNTISRLRDCLAEFSKTSGLEANPSKCSIFMSGVDDNLKNQICNLLNFTEGTMPLKYLGLPLIAKRLSWMDCSPLINKISDQFNNWLKRRSLSYAGRLQLIKTVIMGIQNYWTSNYILPIKVLQKIDKMCSDFLWGHKIHLVSWGSICQETEHGGLGIYSAVHWNYTMAAKLLWMIHLKKDILWIKWIHGHYLRQHSIWQVQPRKNDSWQWKQLLRVRNLLIDKFGSVNNLQNVIRDSCANDKIKVSVLCRRIFQYSNLATWSRTVWGGWNLPKHSFILWEVESIIMRFWWGSTSDERKIHWVRWQKGKYFRDSDFLSAIVGLDCGSGGHFTYPTTPPPVPDRLIWHYEEKGATQSRAGSDTTSTLDSRVAKWWSLIWQAVIPPKIRVFLWRLFYDALPTLVGLSCKGISVSPSYFLCSAAFETTLHIFTVCSFARLAWESLDLWEVIDGFREGDIIRLGGVVRDHHGHVIGGYSMELRGPIYEVRVGLFAIGCSKVSYVRCTGNDVAHALAKSVDCLSSYFWLVRVPLFLKQSVVEDLAG
ncbi:uncharacterized protein LOC109847817 [Asparagus officinalis]|uniref:uncharacterized protein LOC109847817 n=1 Tax=Asparagus officinalis TaxID=4686 RepID=UPI00098E1E31|nr:uncharacterized protein LOC109847817 [Asparagus officinalis]